MNKNTTKLITRILALVLALVLVVGLVATVAHGEAALTGRAGGNAVWSFDPDTGVLTVSGKGVMFDYDGVQYRPWAGYADQIKHIVIEEGITALGRNAFYNTAVETVEFPSTLVRIAAGTFKHCPELKSVDLSGASLTGIEKQAFANCPALESVALPAVISGGIWFDAFNGAPALASATAEGNDSLAAVVLAQAQKDARRPEYPVQFTFGFTGQIVETDASGNLYIENYVDGVLTYFSLVDGSTGKVVKFIMDNGVNVRTEFYDASGALIDVYYPS